MDLAGFVRQRRATWTRLERMLGDVEELPGRHLGTTRLYELLRAYRQVCSDLNEARALTANPDLLGRLNDLASRGYRALYRRVAHTEVAASLARFVSVEAPRAFRRERPAVLLAASAFVLGTLFGAGAVVADPGNTRRLVPGQFFTESPRERVERIENGEERIDSVEKALTFGSSLYTHNIRVAFLAFSLGAATIVGGLWLLFANGVILGAIATTYVLDGVTGFFVGWVGPHGALELPSIVFAGAAGIRVGQALLLPGERAVGQALREAFPSAWRMMATVVLMLVAAGLIEGSLSQFSSNTFPTGLKIGVAIALFSCLMGYLFVRDVDSGAGGS